MGREDGLPYLITELLDGETLRQKLNGGALPQRRALEYAVQIARGLAAAHDANLVHRDLKPENVFVTRDGRVKILDFGIATPAAADGPSTTTRTPSLTGTGVAIGTASYMAPEQVRGEPVDRRTDIFAFGAVLYEMLSGRRAFQRSSPVETMAAVANDDPPEITRTPDRPVSAALEHVVRRCLEKDRKSRFQSATDLAYALQLLEGTDSHQLTAATPPRRRSRRALIAAAAAAALACLAIGALAGRWAVTAPAQPWFHQVTFGDGAVISARIVPGSDTVVYTAAWQHDAAGLFTSRADGSDVRHFDARASLVYSVSASGELAVGMNDTGRLAVVPLSGGAPHELMDNVTAADWSPTGSELAVAVREGGETRVEYPIGNRRYATSALILDLRVAPSGRELAFIEYPFAGDDQGYVVMLGVDGVRHVLTKTWIGIQGLAWSADGREIWFSATETTDAERAVYGVTPAGALRLLLRSPGPLALKDIAPDGRVLLSRFDRRIQVVAKSIGGATRTLSQGQILLASGISRDGRLAVLTDMLAAAPYYRVFLAPLDGSPQTLLGNGTATDISPDGQWVAVLTQDDRRLALLRTSVGQARTLTGPDLHYVDARWSSDGRALIVRGHTSDGPLRFWRQDLADGAVTPLTPRPVDGEFVRVRGRDYVLAAGETGGVLLYPGSGGPPSPVRGLGAPDDVLGGSHLDDALFVLDKASRYDWDLQKLDIPTGHRHSVAHLEPIGDAATLYTSHFARIADDDRTIVYTQQHVMSVLYFVEGLR